MTIEQILAEQVRLGAAWDAVQVEVQRASRRFKRTRDLVALDAWDQALTAQEDVMAAKRANTAALREAVEA